MLTDIRLSAISDKAHVAVDISNVQGVKKAAGEGFFATLCQFCETLLSGHDDAEKVQIGFDEKTQKVTVSPEIDAANLDVAMKSASSKTQVIADLQAQLATAKQDSEAKDKTIAELQAKVEELTPKP